jgi:hypothetical protein
MDSTSTANNRARPPLPVYETWDISPLELPPRSRLYCMEPVGLGTPMVESITGYTARLTEAYSVHTATLVALEILPKSGLPYLAGQQEKVAGTFWRKSVALNGTGEWATNWVQTLEALTMRTELRELTALTWASVLSPRGLLKRTRAWCPRCYQDWHSAGTTLYDPLIWAFKVITFCLHHECSLIARCPHEGCQKEMPPLAPRTRPGFCARCDQWLGLPASATSRQHVDISGERQWTWDSVAGLLSATHCLKVDDAPPKARIAEALGAYLDRAAGGDPRELARLCDLSPRSMRDMLAGAQVPQLGTLLQICRGLGTNPLVFLLGYDPRPGGGGGGGNDGDGASRDATGAVGSARSHDASSESRPPRGRRRKGKTPRAFQAARVRGALEAALADTGTPRPLRAVALQAGYDPSHLHHHFPGLCRAIAARYKAYVRDGRVKRIQRLQAAVRQATTAQHSQGVYPSYRRVMALLDKPSQMHEPQAVIAWHQTLQELGWPGSPDTQSAA